MDYTILAPIAGVLALAFAGYLAYSVMKENAGTDRMRQISSAAQEGAMAYLNRQYKTISIIAIIIALAMIVAGVLTNDLNAWLWVMGGFIVGAVLSAAAGYIGMNISVRSETSGRPRQPGPAWPRRYLSPSRAARSPASP